MSPTTKSSCPSDRSPSCARARSPGSRKETRRLEDPQPRIRADRAVAAERPGRGRLGDLGGPGHVRDRDRAGSRAAFVHAGGLPWPAAPAGVFLYLIDSQHGAPYTFTDTNGQFPPAHGRTGHLVSGPRPRRRWTVTTATTDAGGAGPGRGGRTSRPRGREAVPRLPRGGDPGTVSARSGSRRPRPRAGVAPSRPAAGRRSRPSRPAPGTCGRAGRRPGSARRRSGAGCRPGRPPPRRPAALRPADRGRYPAWLMLPGRGR